METPIPQLLCQVVPLTHYKKLVELITRSFGQKSLGLRRLQVLLKSNSFLEEAFHNVQNVTFMKQTMHFCFSGFNSHISSSLQQQLILRLQ